MTSFDNALKSDEGNSVYPPDLAKAIFELDIPDRIYLKTAMEFDDKYIVNKGNKWTFDYSGSRRYLVFNQDYISNKLNKYICFKYASTRFPTKLPALHLDWRNIISYCREHGGFSLSTLRLFIEKEDIDNATFYSVLFGLKILCAETFPGFNLEDYDDLEFVPRPYLEHWGVYQEIDNILDPLEKNMICNGLFEMASLLRDGKSFSHSEVRNAAILGLAYVTGARPVQLARLAVKDVRIDTRNQESGLIRYSVFLPYAKQRRVTTERLFLAIPPEIGELIMNYTVNEMNRFKGIVEHLPIDKEYSQFMKAMLVVVYRQGNRSMSPAVAKATLMILKRWYHAMLYETGQTHPSYLSTVVIQRAMDLLSSVSSPSDPNTANYKGRCVSLQKLVNHFTFTLVKLQYNSDVKYTNKTNLTRKARETMALKQQAKLSDTTTDGEDALITIRGFLNIVALIQRVESDAEKIALNCLLLLVITGFRSIEAFNLRQDALFKRQIDDPAICKRFQDKGLPDYFLGIRYVGVKGAGERTHWVEPLAVPLVESIFSTVKMLTAPIRSHLTYLRAKSFADYLPQAISNMPGERVELDDVVKYITQTTSSFRGRAGQRDKTSKALSKRGVLPVQEIPGPKNSKSIYYSKTALNHYIKTEFGLANANEPCTHAWMENGKRYQVNYEDLLFLHEKGSLALKRTLALLATPIPFTNTLMNKFLGNVEPDGSVFSKYQLLEEDGTSTRMRTHIPRHNINTFLAIADISDHLQAMLMGRVDITQNQHYQHLALAERRKAASLVPLQPISTALTVSPSSSSIATPLDIVKRTGQLAVTEHMTLDNTIKANLHTFDDRDDVARFVEASFANGLFEDVAAAFEEIRDAEGPEQASDMVARHAVLYPLKFGSCMREVNLWGCPYRLKCQSAAFCEHFTLTGRIDELPNLIAKKQALQQAHSKLTQLTQHQPDYQTRLADIERRLQQLEAIQAQWHRRAKTQQLVAAESVLSGGVITEGKVRTLAQLFALEYQQLMQEND
ncbi:hypothetical protein [Escherichia coli]|uniref:hypothetical protein n=7 Tax=Enterobacteriaceae TaxID=543 RepID=UPI003A776DFA